MIYCTITRGGISDALSSHYKEKIEGEKRKEMIKGYYVLFIFRLQYASYVKFCFVLFCFRRSSGETMSVAKAATTVRFC